MKDRRNIRSTNCATKAVHFIGDVSNVEVLGTNLFKIYHRVAHKWRHQRVVLLGDAAHLITPMWALGLNTGILDANSIAWRMAWILRGWAGDRLLDFYELEQKPVAERGSGEMAEAARAYMARRSNDVRAMSEHAWGNAYTRSLLGVRLGIDGSGNWSMVKAFASAAAGRGRRPRAGRDRPRQRGPPDPIARSARSRVRRPLLYRSAAASRHSRANNEPWLTHYAVSRWDAPRDSSIRDRALLDVGSQLARRYGCPPETMVLVRPDDHVAAIQPISPGTAQAGLPHGAGNCAPGGSTSVTIAVSYRFDEAVILITGAGSGIGAALARHCAREGATVIAVDRRHDLAAVAARSTPEPAAGSTCASSMFRTRPPLRRWSTTSKGAIRGSMPPCSAPPSSIAPISRR